MNVLFDNEDIHFNFSLQRLYRIYLVDQAMVSGISMPKVTCYIFLAVSNEQACTSLLLAWFQARSLQQLVPRRVVSANPEGAKAETVVRQALSAT